MRMMRILIIKTIKLLVIVEIVILSSYFFISHVFYANVQIASLSSFLVILGSAYAHKKMVHSQVLQKNFIEDRDTLDTIDDPHGLYEEKEEDKIQDTDLKEVIKEERAKIKTLDFKTIKEGARAGISLFRIIPYLFLILGFIALKNNEILEITVYLPAILLGIVVASITSKSLSG